MMLGVLLSLLTQIAFSNPFGIEEKDFNPRYAISPDAAIQSHIKERDFKRVILDVARLYSSEIVGLGQNFVIGFDWQNPYMTAYAQNRNSVYSINFWGGMARIPGMTLEGWAFVACHEMGHIFGGAPKIQLKNFLWSSSEGQSDYFASANCLKRYFKKYYDEEIVPKNLSPFITSLCHETYKNNKKKIWACEMTAMAAQSFSKVLYYLHPELSESSLHTPSENHVEFTLYNAYPDDQCRVDTILSGALCDKDPYKKDWACTENRGFRPPCWFNTY